MAEGLVAAGKVVLAVAIGLPLVLYFLQERLIFYPQPLGADRRAEIARRFSSSKEIFIQAADGTHLHAWHVAGAAGAPLVLYFGGNAEDVSWMLAEVAGRTPGVGWLLIDYRGYGASEGSPSETALSSDALAWYDHALSFKPKQVFVFGRSLGSGVAVSLASERPVAGVVLVTPFDSLVEVARRYYPYLPVSWILRHRFDSVGRAPQIAAPLLCLVATHDEVIPPAHAKKLYDAWAGPKRWIELKNAGHNSTDGAPAFWQSITAFLEKSPPT